VLVIDIKREFGYKRGLWHVYLVVIHIIVYEIEDFAREENMPNIR
jgi:hypothetical protein